MTTEPKTEAVALALVLRIADAPYESVANHLGITVDQARLEVRRALDRLGHEGVSETRALLILRSNLVSFSAAELADEEREATGRNRPGDQQ
ncbi:MAG: hypothetical protein QM809_01120 [Gordonia sp. (in: high G+C Gram-positive bacteria)]|uniref:hypothetical protein n=1 Tax=Gordonia sp. (in: high G+C Gram-positive bacteria) TaxID=84139 RepID=UPI0039E5DBD7